MPYTVVLLDIDGTIIDSNDAHAHAWQRALERHGRVIPFHEIRTRIGMGGDKLLQEVAGIESDSAQGRRISSARRAIFSDDYLPRLRPTRGARRMIEWLGNQGIAIAIATSAEAQEVNGLLKAAGVEDLIDHVASSGDAEASKPDPDIVLAALKKSGQPRERAFMIGDTPYDIQAATAAGIATIALRTGGWADDNLKGALAVFDDPDDFVKIGAIAALRSAFPS